MTGTAKQFIVPQEGRLDCFGAALLATTTLQHMNKDDFLDLALRNPLNAVIQRGGKAYGRS
jgi:hypothetical protein